MAAEQRLEIMVRWFNGEEKLSPYAVTMTPTNQRLSLTSRPASLPGGSKPPITAEQEGRAARTLRQAASDSANCSLPRTRALPAPTSQLVVLCCSAGRQSDVPYSA